eukprot:GHVT01078686.1.p2 GENE.GHVT01078686.1~~GHVT01078686.1.p2  ORF type:complete len:107 (+),score=22.28 GHVT01078686.1:372-692(+)
MAKSRAAAREMLVATLWETLPSSEDPQGQFAKRVALLEQNRSWHGAKYCIRRLSAAACWSVHELSADVQDEKHYLELLTQQNSWLADIQKVGQTNDNAKRKHLSKK